MLTIFSPKSRRLLENVGKYCRVLQATDYIMAYVYCVLDT